MMQKSEAVDVDLTEFHDCERLGHIWQHGVVREVCAVCGIYYEPDILPLNDRLAVIVRKEGGN